MKKSLIIIAAFSSVFIPAEFAEAQAVGVGLYNAGTNSSVGGHNSTAVGHTANAEFGSSTAVGHSTFAGSAATAVGQNAEAIHFDSVAVGKDSSAQGGSVAIGESSSAHPDSVAVGQSSTALRNSVAVGQSTSAMANSAAIGQRSSAQRNAVAVGMNASAAADSTAIGKDVTAGASQIRIGSAAHSDVQIGAYDIAELSSRMSSIGSRSDAASDTGSVHARINQMRVDLGKTNDKLNKGIAMAMAQQVIGVEEGMRARFGLSAAGYSGEFGISGSAGLRLSELIQFHVSGATSHDFDEKAFQAGVGFRFK